MKTNAPRVLLKTHRRYAPALYGNSVDDSKDRLLPD